MHVSFQILSVVFSAALGPKANSCQQSKKHSSITPWINAIINHFYWCATSSEGQPEHIVPKWRSLAAQVGVAGVVAISRWKLLPDSAHSTAWNDDSLSLAQFAVLCTNTY